MYMQLPYKQIYKQCLDVHHFIHTVRCIGFCAQNAVGRLQLQHNKKNVEVIQCSIACYVLDCIGIC